jgi:hypothetical protein
MRQRTLKSAAASIDVNNLPCIIKSKYSVLHSPSCIHIALFYIHCFDYTDDCRFCLINFKKYKCQTNSNREKGREQEGDIQQKGALILRTEKREKGFSIKKSYSSVNVNK